MLSVVERRYGDGLRGRDTGYLLLDGSTTLCAGFPFSWHFSGMGHGTMDCVAEDTDTPCGNGGMSVHALIYGTTRPYKGALLSLISKRGFKLLNPDPMAHLCDGQT